MIFILQQQTNNNTDRHTPGEAILIIFLYKLV